MIYIYNHCVNHSGLIKFKVTVTQIPALWLNTHRVRKNISMPLSPCHPDQARTNATQLTLGPLTFQRPTRVICATELPDTGPDGADSDKMSDKSDSSNVTSQTLRSPTNSDAPPCTQSSSISVETLTREDE